VKRVFSYHCLFLDMLPLLFVMLSLVIHVISGGFTLPLAALLLQGRGVVVSATGNTEA
jgi:hypothetical protein